MAKVEQFLYPATFVAAIVTIWVAFRNPNGSTATNSPVTNTPAVAPDQAYLNSPDSPALNPGTIAYAAQYRYDTNPSGSVAPPSSADQNVQPVPVPNPQTDYLTYNQLPLVYQIANQNAQAQAATKKQGGGCGCQGSGGCGSCPSNMRFSDGRQTCMTNVLPNMQGISLPQQLIASAYAAAGVAEQLNQPA